MFELGKEYTREDIHAAVGGSKQSYLPTKDGAVVAACLIKELNPKAPEVILCGRGPQIERAGEMLAQQHQPIPVFMKLGVNRWQYCGQFQVTASYTGGQKFEGHIAHSGRSVSDVSRVLVMSGAAGTIVLLDSHTRKK